MKIKDIKTHVLHAKLKQPFCFSQWWYDTRTTCIVEIITEDGITGWGECYGPSTVIQEIINVYKEYLIGEDPREIDRHWEYLYNRYRDYGQKGLIVEAISGIDIALWDIFGKSVGLPVYKLLGGANRKEIQAYATGFYPEKAEDPIKILQKEAEDYMNAGFKAMKMKVGFGVNKDYELVKAIRQVIGMDIELMIDANHAYDSVEAIKLGRKLEDMNIGWFEEPVPPEDLRGYEECKNALNIPIAGGECEFTRFGFKDILANRVIDIIQPDTCSAGGLSECKKIAVMANAFGVRYNPHSWGTGIGLAANLHLLANLPYNPLSMNPVSPMLEFDQTEHPYRLKLIDNTIFHTNGYVKVPTGAGLGIEVNRKVLEKYKIK
ncbi:D-galactarolactone cycloisomerase [Vallitalea longa]|uniref:D-galactarolactone cycloisomerase n=1 Tax=Vallitalea longa TaxID=2936439 RepID=A0A9W5YEQ6_9FIRM|nr:mandelate racemase/muconate lactonizing enzyme family protein [Vallitalea longa]GKX30594.1 D-galactarolactone cycloisomerase [Vallitalea longa]